MVSIRSKSRSGFRVRGRSDSPPLREKRVASDGFRRTPVRTKQLSHESGLATVQILDFEDRGALWDLPYEEVGRYQFKQRRSKASAKVLSRIEVGILRLNREVEIPCDPSRREQTLSNSSLGNVDEPMSGWPIITSPSDQEVGG